MVESSLATLAAFGEAAAQMPEKNYYVIIKESEPIKLEGVSQFNSKDGLVSFNKMGPPCAVFPIDQIVAILDEETYLAVNKPDA